MTTAIALMTKKQELIEILKRKAEYRDAMYDEIARTNRRDQWYTDRRRLYDDYQAQCDQLAEQIFEMARQEDEEEEFKLELEKMYKVIAITSRGSEVEVGIGTNDEMQKAIEHLLAMNDDLQAKLGWCWEGIRVIEL